MVLSARFEMYWSAMYIEQPTLKFDHAMATSVNNTCLKYGQVVNCFSFLFAGLGDGDGQGAKIET